MASMQWKAHERAVAKSLEGFRIPRGDNFSRSFPDVVASGKKLSRKATDASVILAECKYSVNNPWCRSIKDLYQEKLLRVTSKDGKYDLLLCELKDIHLFKNPAKSTAIDLTVPKYMKDHLEQSRGYIKMLNESTLDRTILEAKTGLKFSHLVLPIVVLGQKNSSFRLCYTDMSDLSSYLYNVSQSQGSV